MKQKQKFAFFAASLLLASLPSFAMAEAWITLDRWSGNPGNLTVWGGGFGSGDTISIAAGGAAATATANTWGELATTTLAIPLNTPQGPLAVTGTGAPSGLSASNSFYVVQFAPSLSLVGGGNVPGGSVTLSGSGFAPGETVNFRFGTTTAASGASADSSGAFANAAVVIPSVAAGTYELRAVGASSGALSSPIYFYVGGFYPSVSPSTYYVEPGGSVNFTGSGFAPGEQVIVVSSGTSYLSPTADANGSFGTTEGITVPFYFAGQVKTFIARGTASGASASVMVAVGALYPSLIPSAYYATPGSTLAFSGRGFGAGEGVRIFEGSSTSSLARAVATDGSFSSSTITIPFSMSGSTRLFRAQGEMSRAEANVSVTVGSLYPSLMPSSYFVLAGYPFNLSGTGFAPDEHVTFTVGGAPASVTATANASGNFFMAGPLRATATSTGPVDIVARGTTSGVSAAVTLTIGRLYPTVTPSEYWLYPLQNLEFRGSGFVPEENVVVRQGTSTLATVRANGFGNFTQAAVAPSRSGPVEYSFTGESSGASAVLSLNVAGLYPSVTAQNYYVAPGDQVFVQGSGFLNNESVRIEVGTTTAATVAANGVGNVAPAIVTMPIASGSVTVRLTGLASGASASTMISLVPFAPQVAPSAWYARPGSAISFTGTGFAPGESVAVTQNGTSTLTVMTTATGTLQISGLSLPYGSSVARYVFTGALSGASATVDVTVASVSPWMSLDTYYAAPGMPLTVYGRGYGANETVTISADAAAFATSTADASGNFDLLTRVPGVSAGDHAITGTGVSSGAAGRTGMTVAQQYLDFQLGAYAAAPGATMRFFGGGYVPGETLEIRTDRTGDTVVHGVVVGPDGRFDDAGYVIPMDFAEGTLTLTARGLWSQAPRSVTIYVTGR